MFGKDESITLQAEGRQKGGDDLPPQRFEAAEPDTKSQKAQDPQEALKDLQAAYDNLKHDYEEAKQKSEKHWEMLVRKEADMQNLQKRMQTQVDNAKKFALERFAAELLQVVDSIEQGLTHCDNENASVKDVLEGMILTRKVVLDVMEKEGIQQIDPQGEAFNPTFHEAIATQPTEELPPNQVVTVVQKGYVLNERLLRPARVVVSCAPTQE